MSIEPPNSPCVGLCGINPDNGWCMGCFRTLAEIEQWSEMNPLQQWQVIGEAENRQARYFDDEAN